MKIYIFSIVFIFLFGLNSSAQKDFSDLLSLEDSIKSYSKMIYNENKDSSKLALNLKLLSFFQKALNNQASFYFPFDSLKHITKLTSPDNKLRFYIWAIELSDKSFNYFGFLQYYNKNEKKFIYSGLVDNARNSEKLELAILNPDNWYGSLYYKILINKHRKKIYYTLLGWDGNNYMSRKKIIDVLYFNDDNKPCFGEPIFVMDKETKYRVIFEYSAEAVMLLKYDYQPYNVNKNKVKWKNMIIFDRLIPPSPVLQGNFRFYIPAVDIFDAFIFVKGKWNLIKNISPRNPKNLDYKPKSKK